MKILTLATRYSTGGAQLNSVLVASELKKRGWVSKSAFLFDYGDMELPEGLEVEKMYSGKASWYGLTISFYRFIMLIVRYKPNVVIGFHPLSNILACFAKILNPRLVVVGTQRNPSSSMSKYTIFIEKLAGLYLYDENICVSISVKDSFSSYPKRYREKLAVVYNGIDFIGQQSKPGSEKVVGFIGRLEYQKNPEVFIRAAALFLDRNKAENVKFLVAGSGDLRPSLNELVNEFDISSNIEFVGPISGSDVIDFYNKINVFVLTSRYEGFGRTIIENMRFGNLMILNDLAVTREVADDTAFYFNQTPQELCEKMEDVLCNFDSYLIEKRDSIVSRSKLFLVEKMIDGYQDKIMENIRGKKSKCIDC